MPNADYQILKLGNPALYQKAYKVEDPTSQDIQNLIAQMIAIVNEHQAIGLAAPQIGIPLAIIVFQIPTHTNNPKYHLTPQYDPLGVPMTVLVNPEVANVGTQMIEGWEGCLSVPGLIGKVARFNHVTYRYQTPSGQFRTQKCSGFHARAVQHEYDHLKGILYPDHIKDIRKLGFTEEIIQTEDFINSKL